MPTLTLHHYKNHEMPYAAKVVKNGEATKLEYEKKKMVKSSADKTYGDYQITINKEGFYLIRNAQEKENGDRLYFFDANGAAKFPFITDPAKVKDIKARIVRGETITQIAMALGLR